MFIYLIIQFIIFFFFFSSRRRHTRFKCDWSSDVCSSDLSQGLTALMNSFLTPLTNAIIDRKGTIDKYMGDAIMAFWSAPIEDPRHELNACEAALDMLDRVDNLNREREQAAKENSALFIPIQIGVGINTGK